MIMTYTTEVSSCTHFFWLASKLLFVHVESKQDILASQKNHWMNVDFLIYGATGCPNFLPRHSSCHVSDMAAPKQDILVVADDDDSTSADKIEAAFKSVQTHICDFLVQESGQAYIEDLWDYDKGAGGGISRLWEAPLDEDVHLMLEKAGVNFSGIHGPSMPESAATAFKIPPNTPYRATGVSLVIHPLSPHIPTIHANIRYFECGGRWWFGGGIDVTPYYVKRELVVGFHKALRELCERWGYDYRTFKQQCDEYFVNKHRNGEARGVGGLFFDHLTTGPALPKTKKEICDFVVALGMLFPQLYSPFISEGRPKEVTKEQREFQLYRRSRYVEFNLLHDRGTKFGLQSQGRVESILMSMPPLARWKYNWQPKEGTPEAELYKIITPQDWAFM